MSYYPSEKNGKGYLRSGFYVKTRELHTSDEAMKPCFEFDLYDLCVKFCELLLQGFESIYNRYPQPILKQGDKVYWISVYSQSHLRALVIPESQYCENPNAYTFHYTFNNELECHKALVEMQAYANDLYVRLNSTLINGI